MSKVPDFKRLVTIRVETAPPAKDGSLSIRNPKHDRHELVVSLREAMGYAMKGQEPFVGVPLSLQLHVWRRACQADALNLINGVADVIQRRCDVLEYQHDVWVFDDDKHVREFHYSEEYSARDAYEVVVAPL